MCQARRWVRVCTQRLFKSQRRNSALRIPWSKLWKRQPMWLRTDNLQVREMVTVICSPPPTHTYTYTHKNTLVHTHTRTHTHAHKYIHLLLINTPIMIMSCTTRTISKTFNYKILNFFFLATTVACIYRCIYQ